MKSRGDAYIERLRAASRGDYVVGSFNIDSLDVLGQLAVRAAEARSPIIFQFGPWSVRRLSIEQIGRAGRALLEPCPGGFLHLDHCTDPGFVRQGLVAGFDSAMFDGSSLSLEENIARTKEIVRIARELGAAVEGALGVLERGSDTSLADARRFVEESEVDALAVAVGTRHGHERAPADIDLARLRELSTLGVPLVIHGGSGLPVEVISDIRRTAVAKINVATALYRNYHNGLQRLACEGELPPWPSAISSLAADAFWEVARERIELFGCVGKEAEA